MLKIPFVDVASSIALHLMNCLLIDIFLSHFLLYNLLFDSLFGLLVQKFGVTLDMIEAYAVDSLKYGR